MSDPNAGLQWLCIHLAVSDLDRSIRFYCEGLGFTLKHRFGEHVAPPFMVKTMDLPTATLDACIIARGDMALEMVAFKDPAPILENPRKPVNRVGPGLMLFNCPDAAAVAKRLMELGAECVFDGTTVEGAPPAYILTDPDGARIQLVSLPQEQASGTFRS